MSRPYFNVKEIYTGTGSLSEYTFDFKITDLTKLRIIVVDNNNVVTEHINGTDTTFLDHVELGTTVVDGQKVGGTVFLKDPLLAGYRIALILDDSQPVQEYKFRNKTSFDLIRFEDALDAITGAVQGFVLKAKQALRISDMDDENSFDAQLPPGIDEQADRVLAVNEDGTGFKFGPTITHIAEAEAAALEAIAAKEAAEIAAETAEDAALQAQIILFDGEVSLSDADSPVDFQPAIFNNKIVRIDAANGDVIINLNPLATYPEGFKAQFMRSDSEPTTTVTIVPDGTETIDNAAPYELPLGTAVIISPDTNVVTNWVKKFLGVTSGGGSVPAGGVDGDYLEVTGGVLGFASGIFEGFSARYGQALNLPTVRDALLFIFQFQYLGPLVSLAASGSGTIREKGVAVTSSTLTASVTKRSTAISRIQFFLNGVSINDNNPPSNTGSGNTSYNWTGSITDTATFRVDVTDTSDGTNGPTIAQSSVNFTFVYPFFWGSAAPDAAVADLVKQVVGNSNNRNVSYTGLTGQKFYYAFPASYGDLTSIKDVNNFEVLGSFTKKTKNWVAADGATVSYTIYELTTALGVNLNTSFTFIR